MMKDFSEWLNDLTGELQEPDPHKGTYGDFVTELYAELENRAPKAGDYWITPDGWGIVDDSFLGTEPEPKADGPGYITKPMAVHIAHNLYRTGDADAPDCIKDSRNDDVVLGMCRICGKAEVELSEPCEPPVVEASHLEQSTKRLDEYRRNPYQWMESDENE